MAVSAVLDNPHRTKGGSMTFRQISELEWGVIAYELEIDPVELQLCYHHQYGIYNSLTKKRMSDKEIIAPNYARATGGGGE